MSRSNGEGVRHRMDASQPPLFRVRFIEETPSTNDEVKRALEQGEPEGLVVRARRQMAGYGRQGRAWASPEGGLYCSLLLRPQVEPAALPTLSLVTGLAVRRAIIALAGASAAEAVRIKWPNDVVLMPGCARVHDEALAQNDRYERFFIKNEDRDLGLCEHESDFSMKNRSYRDFCATKATTDACRSTSNGAEAVFAKLCGISLEAHAGGVCVGVGVNVLPPAERPAVGGKNRPAYVADLAPRTDASVERVLDAFLASFAPLYAAWLRDGFAPLVDEFNAHASLTGQCVRMVDRADNVLAAGTVRRVDAYGRLVLCDESGAETPVSSGEAHLA